jgi:hypothetical protein
MARCGYWNYFSARIINLSLMNGEKTDTVFFIKIKYIVLDVSLKTFGKKNVKDKT